MSSGDLVLPVGELLHRPGSRRQVRAELISEGYEVGSAAIAEGVVVELDLVVESTADPGTLVVSGTLEAPWRGECRRCLEEVGGELSTSVREIYSTTPLADEVWSIEEDEIHLADLVREVLLLALPLAPLCGSECRGPAPQSYPTGSELSGPAEEPPRDPRWAALDDLDLD